MKLNYLSPMKHCSGILRYALVISFVFSCMIFQTQAQLSGTYTIDPSKSASGINYKNFRSLEADIDSGKRYDGGIVNGKGLSGNIDVKIADGIYNEGLTTANLNNTTIITFESASGDSSKVIITNSILCSWKNQVWKKLSFIFKPNTSGFNISGNSFQLKNSVIKGSDDHILLAALYCDSVVITNNSFRHGQEGIDLGNIFSNGKHCLIANNTFDSLYMSIDGVEGSAYVLITGNTINSNVPSAYGIVANEENILISQNKIFLHNSGIAVYLYNSGVINLYNNILSVSGQGSGVQLTDWAGHSTLNMYYNTISVTSLQFSTNSYGLSLTAKLRTVNFVNNIVSVKNTRQLFSLNYSLSYYSSTPDSDNLFKNCDNNIYDLNGSRFSLNFVTLCQWQAAKKYDHYSYALSPALAGGNMQPLSKIAAMTGTPISQVLTDINGDVRSTSTPSAGTYEETKPDAAAAFTYCIDTAGNVSFRDTSYSNCGSINKYAWSFGDGNTGSSKDVSHAYKAGTYLVTHTIKTNSGCADTVSELIHIDGRTHEKFGTTYCGSSVVLRDSSTVDSGYIARWLWDFGDGTTAEGPNPEHIYPGTAPRLYTVKLKLISDQGKIMTLSKSVIYPTMSQGFEFVFLGNSDTVKFIDTTHFYVPVKFKRKWFFNIYDPTADTSANVNPEFVFKSTSFVQSHLSYVIAGCPDTSTVSTYIDPTNRVDFTYTQLKGNDTVYFSTSSTSTAKFWDFGDSTTSTSDNPKHVFKHKGLHTVRLLINRYTFSATGVERSFNDGKFLAAFTAPVVCKGNTTTFTDLSNNPSGGTLTYSWDFGDGTTSTNQNPTHKFSSNEIVWLKIKSTSGLSDSVSHLVTIDTTCVWPGDANSDKKANIKDVLNIGLAYSDSGATRSGASISWTAQPCQDWAKSFASGVNHKHADCNGDGKINISDLGAIVANYGSTHPKTGNIGKGGPGDPVLYLSTQQDSVNVSDTLHVLINLGTLTTPVKKVYGIAFSIAYDNTAVDTTKALITDFSKCWLGTAGKNLISLVHNNAKAGVVDIAISRTDHLDVAGYGQIGDVGIIIPDNVAGKDYIHKKLRFSIIDIKGITAEEADVPLNTQDDSVLIYQEKTSLNAKQDKDAQLLVYPNPTNGQLFITSRQSLISRVQVMDITGRIVLAEKTANQSQYTLNIQALSSGIYYLDVLTNAGPVRTRFVKQ